MPRSKIDGWVKGLLNRTFGSYALATIEWLSSPLAFVSIATALSSNPPPDAIICS